MIIHLISFEMTGAVYVLTLINNILCMLPDCCLFFKVFVRHRSCLFLYCIVVEIDRGYVDI